MCINPSRLIFAILSSASLAYSEVSFGLALGSDGFRDNVLVPLVFSGPSTGVVAEGEYRKFGVAWQPHAELRLGYATNRFGHEAILLFYQTRILAWKSLPWGASIPLQWGFGLDMQARDAYIFSWDDSHLYWLSNSGFIAALRSQIQLDNGWMGQCAIAGNIVSYVAHRREFPDNKVDPLKTVTYYASTPWTQGEWQMPWQYSSAYLELRMRTPSRHWSYVVSGQFANLSEQAFSLGAGAHVKYHWGVP